MSETVRVEDEGGGTPRHGSDEGSVEALVLDAAKRLLTERSREESPAQAWVTGSEIAHLTGIDKDVVHASLEQLGHRELHIEPVGPDIEVHGVDHGRGADSHEEPVDE